MTTLNHLYVAYTNGNGQSAYTVHDRSNWSPPTLLQATTASAPALAAHDGKLVYAARGHDDKLWISTNAGTEPFTHVPGTGTTSAPGLTATSNGELHIGCRTVT
ncbi:hypothetical protein ACH4TC_34640 [Streptomyces spororaveus]|uniref:hypothetical protein n=1 Tax=Streptomyces spororaveus TaxID=284039 RepID=UPI0037A15E31